MRSLPTITLLLLLVPAVPASAQTWRVAPNVELAAGATPTALAVGEFNSDGRQDLAIADAAGKVIHIRTGNGDGTLGGDRKVVGTTVFPEHIAVADFNADGNEDLSVAAITSSASQVGVARGAGDGAFTIGTGYGVGRAHSLAVGDFNADGWSDLAVAAAEQVVVRRGIGGGSEGRVDIPLGAPARSLASGDFDGNGAEDVVVLVNGAMPRLIVLPGRNDGTFADGKVIQLADEGSELATGDVNGDARDDVVVAVPSKDRVVVRLGNGDGTLREGLADVAVGDQPEALAVGDVDGDGNEDVVTANAAADSVSVRPGNGDGSFRDDGDTAVGDRPLDVVIGDFDADGRNDLATANHDAGTVSVRLGAGALGGNLLVNGGFEQGLGARTPAESPDIPGWTTVGGMTFVRFGATPHFGTPTWLDAARFGGGRHFLWGGDSTGFGGVTEASQTVAVTDAAEAIDGGRAEARLSAQLGGGLAFPDEMTATAEFLDADGVALGVLRIGPVTPEERRNATTLQRRTGSAPLPAWTRRIRVTMTSRDTDRWSSAIADNVKLTVTSLPAPQPTSRPAFGPDTRVTISLASRRAPLRVRVANANAFEVTGRLSGRRFAVAAGGRTAVRLPLRKAQRRRLVRRGRVAVRLAAVVADPAGNRRSVSKRVSLRRR